MSHWLNRVGVGLTSNLTYYTEMPVSQGLQSLCLACWVVHIGLSSMYNAFMCYVLVLLCEHDSWRVVRLDKH